MGVIILLVLVVVGILLFYFLYYRKKKQAEANASTGPNVPDEGKRRLGSLSKSSEKYYEPPPQQSVPQQSLPPVAFAPDPEMQNAPRRQRKKYGQQKKLPPADTFEGKDFNWKGPLVLHSYGGQDLVSLPREASKQDLVSAEGKEVAFDPGPPQVRPEAERSLPNRHAVRSHSGSFAL